VHDGDPGDERASRGPSGAATLPSRGFARARVLVGRALARRCPNCGAAGIFSGWFTLREHCPNCNVRFEREEGYFLGAYALNLIAAEAIALGIALTLIFGTSLREASLLWKEIIAVAMPLLFFPFSRTLWIALDLILDPPREKPEQRLRGRIDSPRDRKPRG